MRLSLRRFGRRSYSLLTLLRDALHVIIINILNWLGAVIAQLERQSGEKSSQYLLSKYSRLR